MSDDLTTDELMQLVGDKVFADADPALFSDSRFLSWLSDDLWGAMSSSERAQLEAEANRFARSVSCRMKARKLERRLQPRHLEFSHADPARDMGDLPRDRGGSRCTRLLDLQVAAGLGREIWEEECNTWIELPPDLPDGRYIALRVAGDSMLPLLEPRGVILIQLGTTPAVDDLVVALRPDEGYVVKRVNRILAHDLELEPLNPKYDSFTVPNDPRYVLGTVVARFYES